MKKLIAFTFDDVPSYEVAKNNPTSRMINILADYGGKGTIFIVGSSLRKYGTALIEQAMKYEFELGNHTDTHRNLTKLSYNEIKEEILILQETVSTQIGVDMKYMRPPGLAVNETVFSVTDSLKLPVIFGSRGKADLCDWNSQTTTEYIKRRCLNGAYDGQIVLMHGYSEATAQVFPDICRTLSEDGYIFVTLSELFEMNRIEKLMCDRPIYDIQSALLDK